MPSPPREPRRPCRAQTRVTLTISYEVPSVLVPIGSGLSPFVESILTKDMGRFRAEAEKELAHRQKAAA